VARRRWPPVATAGNGNPAVKKNYILDTNVLLHDPEAMLSFDDNDVIVPIQVVEEIDHFKKEMSERGRNARHVSQLLDGFRCSGRLADGVALEGGGRLRVVVHDGKSAVEGIGLDGTVDNAILALALDLRQAEPGRPLILVTKDTNLRIKADAMGLQAEDFEAGRVRLEELDRGDSELEVPPEVLKEIKASGRAPFPNGVRTSPPTSNEYLLLKASGSSRTQLARVSADGQRLESLSVPAEPVWGIKPRNKEQHFALDALLDDRLRLVSLMGKAGTGKTVLALAAGLERVTNDRQYHRLLICRPIFPVGKDVGFLPGGLEAKLAPWMQPVYDNLTLLLERSGVKDASAEIERLMHTVVSIEPLTYIRGRSIPNQFMIVDEAQNLTPLEVKTIITRVGEGTKIVLTGDSYQIDNPYVDATSNGFNYVVHKFRGQPLAAHVVLRRGERSDLAELAANLL
jgi:PhoH-like ATPase